MLKKIYETLILTFKIAICSGILGLIVALMINWPIYKGVYIGILLAGLITIFYSSVNFIGLPKERFDFFSGKTLKGENSQMLGDKGWKPAFIGVVLISIAFFIEAIFHSM